MIVIWSGALVDIPDGWALCDGTNGTPNLKEKFIMGAHPGRPPGATGGSVSHLHIQPAHVHTFTGDGHTHGTVPHDHNFTTDGHNHQLIGVGGIQSGPTYLNRTDTKTDTGTTDPEAPNTDEQSAVGTTNFKFTAILPASSVPPYYALAYIMKL